jgi:hypothetical protein
MHTRFLDPMATNTNKSKLLLMEYCFKYRERDNKREGKQYSERGSVWTLPRTRG